MSCTPSTLRKPGMWRLRTFPPAPIRPTRISSSAMRNLLHVLLLTAPPARPARRYATWSPAPGWDGLTSVPRGEGHEKGSARKVFRNGVEITVWWHAPPDGAYGVEINAVERPTVLGESALAVVQLQYCARALATGRARRRSRGACRN